MRRTPPRMPPKVPAPRDAGHRPWKADSPELPHADKFLELVAADYAAIYQVYLAASEERHRMLRLAMTLLSAPFAATVALVSAQVIDPMALSAWATIPRYVFALVLVFGLLAVLPYVRMIEALGAHVRAARAINNFRLLYAKGLRDQFAYLGWSPNLPTDPGYPEPYAPLGWPGLGVLSLAVADAFFLTLGVLGLTHTPPVWPLVLICVAVTSALLYSVYYVRSNVSRRRREPENPLGFPYVET
ncbi:MAG: hypothetical protein GEV11_13905 [Streptosporangiales bacterium]|nr:hypothetical protein [Streptosporangiales bacterium]